MLELCEVTLGRSEAARFVQTGVGWLLRELWRADAVAVVALIESSMGDFSSEGLRYATEKMPKPEQQRLRALRKSVGG
jgi:3-methyladenine DNA glycosylase AlkD